MGEGKNWKRGLIRGEEGKGRILMGKGEVKGKEDGGSRGKGERMKDEVADDKIGEKEEFKEERRGGKVRK